MTKLPVLRIIEDLQAQIDAGGEAGPGDAPRPQAASGVGQWVLLRSESPAGQLFLPAGGTWAFYGWQDELGIADAGIAAGGSALNFYPEGEHYTPAYGFAWRIA